MDKETLLYYLMLIGIGLVMVPIYLVVLVLLVQPEIILDFIDKFF